MKLIKPFLTLSAFILISACSEDTSTSAPKAAVITTANSQDLAIAATAGTSKSVNPDSTPSFDILAFSNALRDLNAQSATSGTALADYKACSTGDNTNTTNVNISNDGSSSVDTTITFTDCDLNASGVIVNGELLINSTYDATTYATSFSMIFNNFTVSEQGIVENIDFSMQCGTVNTTTFEYACTTSSNITAIDSRNYAIKDSNITGDATSGYNISATVTDPDHGDIAIEATNILFNCPAPDEDRPSTGSITFTSSGKSGAVTFDSCSTYTVAVDGLATSYTLP